MKKAWIVAWLGAALVSAPASSQRADPVPEVPGPLVGPIASDHGITVAGSEIPYRAVFREYELRSAQGRALATISATAYLRSDVSNTATRPVFFFFNGGPGASSSPLHFSAFGPRLRPPGRDVAAPFIDNPDSPLDAADLVFVDPVGTGFSRVLPGGGGRPYWAPNGDAEAMWSLIHRWLEDNGRIRSPVFIGGESYGSFRLATMMRDAGDLDLRGLLLISPATSTAYMAGADSGDLDRVFTLPVMAVAAWHHEAVPRNALSIEAHHQAALEFAESDYLVALHKGSDLSEAERRRVAERMAELIGLPSALILEKNLLLISLFVFSLFSSTKIERFSPLSLILVNDVIF